jgi:hypothetical protein
LGAAFFLADLRISQVSEHKSTQWKEYEMSRNFLDGARIRRAMRDLAIVLFTLVVGTILWAVALTVLWGWFVVPLGVPSINAAEAVGLSVVVAMFRKQADDELKGGIVAHCTHAFVTSVVTSLLLLGLGGFAHLFV